MSQVQHFSNFSWIVGQTCGRTADDRTNGCPGRTRGRQQTVGWTDVPSDGQSVGQADGGSAERSVGLARGRTLGQSGGGTDSRRLDDACTDGRTVGRSDVRLTFDIEQQDYSPVDYPVSKKLINLLRHGSLHREDDGAIEFWRFKDYLRNDFVHSQQWSDDKWKSTMAKRGGNKKIFQYCTDPSGEILYLRALQGHSGRNLIDPSLQDTVLIPDDFFEYIYHVGCAINLQSIINSELGSEVAGQAESSQPTQPNLNPIHRTGRPVMTEQTSRSSAQEIDTRFSLGCESTNLSVERSDKDKDADENVDADRVRTGRPVGSGESIGLFTQREEIDIDFRVSGLPHAVVKQAENSRVRELVKQNESHPYREALQADLQQNNVYNPFSDDSNELCETIPKVQCSECLLYWNQGIVYCTCGHILRENKSSRHLHRWQLGLLSIPDYVIKKERLHDNRHGKTEAQKEYFIAHNLRKGCNKKGFEGIHGRFQKDFRFRDSQLKIDRTEAKCIKMDEVAKKDFTYHLSWGGV